MANTGLLILTNPTKVGKILSLIKKRHVLQTLYIKYLPEATKERPKSNVVSACNLRTSIVPNLYFHLMISIYTLATKFLTKVDVRLLLSSAQQNYSIINTKKPIELVIFDKTYNNDDAKVFIQNHVSNASQSFCEFSLLPTTTTMESEDDDYSDDQDDNDKNVSKCYKNVVLGGTFDRLHNGHKILLSKAALHCSEKLTVGITDEIMIQKKLLWELIEPCEERIRNVKDFLEDIKPSLKYNVVPINDMYGPTKSDPSFNMIVVSEETQKGALKINELRSQTGLSVLDIEVVKLIEDVVKDENSDNHHEEQKISSSNHRIRLLGTRLKTPDISGKSLKPYIIGLTGGIASGKSSVAEKLKSLGAGVVECDKLAHKLYQPGESCYKYVVENFGKKILSSDGLINRKALANIVFNDQNELDKLNKGVWPAILDMAMERVRQLQQENKEIIVMEAAVLIQAEWQNICHEVWTCIIPHDEAVRRIMERNNSSVEEAELRIKAQPTNVEQVNAATVVLSTLWSHEVTLSQVQKAWDSLHEFLSNHSK